MAGAPASSATAARSRRKRTDSELRRTESREAVRTEALDLRATELARFYQGKVETVPKVPIRHLSDFAVWYTPGIAEVSRVIHHDPDEAFHLTGRWNTIAILTDGSRVLGLGDVGPQAALPVMEGKALLFKWLGGVDAVPLPVSTASPEELIETALRIAPAFGGINLEDIASPKCFHVLEELQKRSTIPVWHDDQLGTAAATVAGLINALRLTNRSIKPLRTVLLGAGAANLVTARLLIAMGHDPTTLSLVDHRGILHPDREDMDELLVRNRWKYHVAIETRGGGRRGGLPEALEGADVLLAASTPNADLVSRDAVRSMAPEPIVFALANPTPEIWPAVAKSAGAAVVATGRSDFPNQVNNSLVFPAVFRGVLDARARSIPDEIVLSAARELAAHAEDKGLTPTHILPTMEEVEVFPHVAAAVATTAVTLGIARTRKTRAEFLARAQQRMRRSARLVRTLLDSGLIAPMPRPHPKESKR